MNRLASLSEFGFKPHHIVDVGANVGSWTDQAVHFFPDSYFLMVEAYSKHEPILKSICEKHDNVDYSIKLLSEKEAELDFYTIKNASSSDLETGNSLLRENTYHYNKDNADIKKINATTLDDLLQQKQIRKVDLLKIDVQGAELLVLKGAENTLKNLSFCLLEVPFQKWNNQAPTAFEVVSFMNHKGFILYDVLDANRASNYTVSVDFLFKKDNGKYNCPNIL